MDLEIFQKEDLSGICFLFCFCQAFGIAINKSSGVTEHRVTEHRTNRQSFVHDVSAQAFGGATHSGFMEFLIFLHRFLHENNL